MSKASSPKDGDYVAYLHQLKDHKDSDLHEASVDKQPEPSDKSSASTYFVHTRSDNQPITKSQPWVVGSGIQFLGFAIVALTLLASVFMPPFCGCFGMGFPLPLLLIVLGFGLFFLGVSLRK